MIESIVKHVIQRKLVPLEKAGIFLNSGIFLEYCHHKNQINFLYNNLLKN